MDIRNGQIYTPEEMGKIDEKAAAAELEAQAGLLEPKLEYMETVKLRGNLREMLVPPTAKQLRTRKVGRNDPCPCGSGKKFKKCCLAPEAANHEDGEG